MMLEASCILLAALSLRERDNLDTSAKLCLSQNQLVLLCDLLNSERTLFRNNERAIFNTVSSVEANLRGVRDQLKQTSQPSVYRNKIDDCSQEYARLSAVLYNATGRAFNFYQRHSYTVHMTAKIQSLLWELANLE